jgi:hypothetical protein
MHTREEAMTPGEDSLENSPGAPGDMHAGRDASNEPISVRDVLRAIFLPPREEHYILPHVNMTHVLEAAALSPDAVMGIPEDLNTPAVIQYEDSPIVSVPEPGPARIASVGIGMLVAVLIAYLAQSATRQEGGVGGALVCNLRPDLAGTTDVGDCAAGRRTCAGGQSPSAVGQPAPSLLGDAELTTRILLASLAFGLSVATTSIPPITSLRYPVCSDGSEQAVDGCGRRAHS